MITTMHDTATIFRREFVARRDLLLAGLAVALLVVVLPFLPGISQWNHTDIRDLASVALAVGAGIALSIGLGATFFGRDLSEGRLGFYLERPVSLVAVWMGRFLAVLTLVVLCEVLILLPARLSSSDGLLIMTHVGWPKSFGVVGWAIVLVAAPAFLLLLAHAGSVMMRARTPWLFLDLVGFTATVIVAWLCMRPFISEGFGTATLVVSLALAVSALVALLAGFAVGVHSGRCDLRRTHRMLSITLWSAVAISFGCVAAYTSWLGDFGPGELGEFEVGPVALNGEWIEVKGTSPAHLDVRRHFLVSTSDSRWLRLPTKPDGWRWCITFSDDGNRALWLEKGHGDAFGFVNYANLERGDLEPVATSITVGSDAYDYLSPSGGRLAIKDEGVLSVYDLDHQRLMTAVKLPEEFHGSRALFVDESTIRLYERSGQPGDWLVSIIEVNASTGTVEHTGSFPIGFEYARWAFDADLRYIAVTGYFEGEYDNRVGNIFDARTGEFIRPIVNFAAFLHDGRVLMIIGNDFQAKSIVVEDPNGENRVEHNLPDLRDLIFIGEGTPGKLLIAHSRDYNEMEFLAFQVDTYDLETGATERVGDGLNPDGGYSWANGWGWFRRQPAGQRLFWASERTLVRWDPDGGELVPVVVGVEGG